MTSAVRTTKKEDPSTVSRGRLTGARAGRRKRAGVISIAPIDADAPNVVWAIDFQFDSTVDGKAIKIASMIDEHTRESLLNIVERSITTERLVTELKKAFDASGGPPKVLRIDNGPELVSQALEQLLREQDRHGLYPGRPSVGTTLTSNRSTTVYGRRASTATTGPLCSRPGWSSATSSTRTTTDIATQRWATARRPSTLRHPGTPTHRWPAASTEPATINPDSRIGWTQ
jgi:putative transposase